MMQLEAEPPSSTESVNAIVALYLLWKGSKTDIVFDGPRTIRLDRRSYVNSACAGMRQVNHRARTGL